SPPQSSTSVTFWAVARLANTNRNAANNKYLSLITMDTIELSPAKQHGQFVYVQSCRDASHPHNWVEKQHPTATKTVRFPSWPIGDIPFLAEPAIASCSYYTSSAH